MSVGSWINSVSGLARKVPGKVWLAVALLLVAAFWLDQHDAQIRRQAQLQQLQQQASAQVAALKKQAEQDIAKANVENAQAIQKLEERRRQIAQQNRQLAAQLAALRKQEQIQVGQVATLPLSEIATRVATQLGLGSGDVAASTSVQATTHAAAGASTLSPGRGLGHDTAAHIAENAMYAPPVPSLKDTAAFRKGAKAQSKNTTPGGGDTAATKSLAIGLTASGARKVETALIELKACRAESGVQSKQVSSCQERAAADDAVIERQASSISSLNQALKAKDQILAQQASECKAELRVAKGTFWSRLAHVAKHVAIGVGIGVVIGVAAR